MTDPKHTPDAPPRDRILDAASGLFAEKGSEGARVDEIAERAGVNKAMLYYHVGDKQALYTAVLMRNFDRVAAALERARAERGTVAERLQRVVAALVEMVEHHPDHPRMMLREVASGAASLAPEVLGRMMEVVGQVRELLEEGMRSGELRRADPILTHLMLIGTVVFMTSIRPLRERAFHLAPEAGIPDDDVDLAAFISDLALNGLRARPTPGGDR